MNDRLNPEIKTILVGKRKLREVKFYPLSIADQFKLTNLLNGLIVIAMTAAKNRSDAALLAQIMGLLVRNLSSVIKLVTDEPKGFKRLFMFWRWGRKSLLKDITNGQMEEIATAIYEVNYKDTIKKVSSLLKGEGAQIPEPLRRLFQSSSESILNTESKMSTEEAGETEE